MPVIVDEVVISVEVVNQTGPEPGKKTMPAEKKQEIINQCVERVLEIIEQKQER